MERPDDVVVRLYGAFLRGTVTHYMLVAAIDLALELEDWTDYEDERGTLVRMLCHTPAEWARLRARVLGVN